MPVFGRFLLFGTVLLFGLPGELSAGLPTYYVQKLSIPGAVSEFQGASAINAQGNLAGTSDSQFGSGLNGNGYTVINGVSALMPSPGDIPTHPGFADVPLITGINDSDVVVGYGFLGALGFIYQNGTYQSLAPLSGNTVSQPLAINASGQVVGESSGGTAGRQAFLYSGGTMQPISAVVGAPEQAVDIDSAGHVLIQSYTSGDALEGTYVYDSGVATRIGAFTAAKFNSAGDIAGTTGNQLTIIHAGGGSEVFTAGDFSSINLVGFNASGQAIGTFRTSGSASGSQYFFYNDGVFYDFRGLLADGQLPANFNYFLTDINDSGEISGAVSRDFENVYYAGAKFSTVPEPGTLALVGIGLACALVLSRRGRAI